MAPNLQSNKRYKLQDTTKCQHSKRYKKEAQKTPTCCRDSLKLWLRLSISVCWTACLTEMRTAFPESSGINSDIKPSRLFTQCRTPVPPSHTASPFSGPSKQVLHGVYPFRPRRFSFQISRKHVSSSNANSHLRGHQIWAPNFQDLAHGTVARTYIILYRRYTTSLQQPLTALTALDWLTNVISGMGLHGNHTRTKSRACPELMSYIMGLHMTAYICSSSMYNIVQPTGDGAV